MRHLRVLLEALSKQTFSDFEVVLVDDASTDESVAWVETDHPDVRILVNRRNLGFAASCNQGADAAHGRVLAFLNNDTEPEPGWLGAIAESICQNPDAAIFASKILLFDDRDVFHTSGDTLGRDGIPRNRGVWQRDVGQYDELTEVFGGSGGGVAYRRDVWKRLGGFDTDFWMYLEDVDFAFRAQLMGWRAVYVPNARMYHHLSATAGSELASYYVGRNTIWNIAKNMPRALVLENLPAIIGAQVHIAVDAFRNVRGKAARARLQGQFAGILGLKRQLEKRKVIQAHRLIKNDDLARLLVE